MTDNKTIKKLEKGFKDLDRLKKELEVQGTKRIIKLLEDSNYDPKPEETAKAVNEAYNAVSQRYADSLGIKDDAEKAKKIGYTSEWGKGIIRSLFAEYSGVSLKEFAESIGKKGLSPSVVGEVISDAHKKLARRLQSITIANLLEKPKDLAEGLTELVNETGIKGSIDPIKLQLNPESVLVLYFAAREASENYEGLKEAFEEYKSP